MTRRGLRRAEYVLLAAGLAILGYCGAELLNSHIQQARGARELDRQLDQTRRNPPEVSSASATIADGTPVGKVEIPKLHLSAVVFQGTSDSILDQGVGHLDASAFPGQAGNVVLAAHRDTFFRSLRHIRRGDLVQVTTPYGVRTYAVDSTEVVKPTETGVMASTATPTLTLITCYPFYYVGHAPKRFIVRASPVSG
jgi:sortase A